MIVDKREVPRSELFDQAKGKKRESGSMSGSDSDNTKLWLLLGIGGAVIAAGVGLYYLGTRKISPRLSFCTKKIFFIVFVFFFVCCSSRVRCLSVAACAKVSPPAGVSKHARKREKVNLAAVSRWTRYEKEKRIFAQAGN